MKELLQTLLVGSGVIGTIATIPFALGALRTTRASSSFSAVLALSAPFLCCLGTWLGVWWIRGTRLPRRTGLRRRLLEDGIAGDTGGGGDGGAD